MANPPVIPDLSHVTGAPLAYPVAPLDVEVGIVCPNYNGGTWAEEWVNSVEAALGDARFSWGAVIVDDGSTDGSFDRWTNLLGSNARRGWDYRLVPLGRNVGAAAARNVGVSCLGKRCRYLLFLDADDLLVGDGMKHLISEVDWRRADLGWGAIDYLHNGEVQPETLAFRHQALQGEKAAAEILLAGEADPIPLLGSVTRRSAFDAAGGFNPALRHCADWDLWLRMASAGARLCPMQGRPLARYRLHGDQLHRRPTWEAFRSEVRAVHQARLKRDAALKMLGRRPSVAVYHSRWSVGGAQAVYLSLAEKLAPRWDVTSVTNAPPLGAQMRDEFVACGGRDVVTKSTPEAEVMLKAADVRFTYVGQILPPGAGLTHLHYGGDSPWNRTDPPDHIRGVYCSRWLKSWLERYRTGEDERGVVIPNSLPVSKFAQALGREEVRTALRIEPEAFVFLWAGRLAGVKNPSGYIRAAELCASSMYGAPVYHLIAGPAYDRVCAEPLWEMLEQSPVREQVRYLGSLPRDLLALVCSASDAFVTTSFFEGLGISVLEAMAAGLPVVGYDAGGVREAVGPDGEKWLTPPGDNGALAEKMTALFYNPDWAKQTGRALAVKACLHNEDWWGVRHEALFLESVSSHA